MSTEPRPVTPPSGPPPDNPNPGNPPPIPRKPPGKPICTPTGCHPIGEKFSKEWELPGAGRLAPDGRAPDDCGNYRIEWPPHGMPSRIVKAADPPRFHFISTEEQGNAAIAGLLPNRRTATPGNIPSLTKLQHDAEPRPALQISAGISALLFFSICVKRHRWSA
ncbi:hypothetical protein CCM_08908 [Cordyceps militaris CM01]|uniref:Uncharacterized protein n=1 Tax=Cordyceps militaris (strain CM01) TaxID=983644 RepID=G3JSL6_CORMM|nr:uncharacterized protein CCM_08908 [Cordyceps militaris CM01]EGX88862.1 hypothetical protein CCM_08908 [Cordyceps militaris CM01]